MNKELFIASTPHETKVAVVEDDLLAEIHYERENEYTLAGSIYKGRVTRVLPGMQSAFVDIGLERDAFLYVTDFLEEQDAEEEEIEPVQLAAPREQREREPRFERRPVEARQAPPLAAEPEIHPHLVEPPAPSSAPVVFEGGVDEDETNGGAEGNDEAAVSDDSGGEEGVRRWRGRRRRGRGGRRGGGRGFPETKFSGESRPQETRERESRPRDFREREPRSDYGPPPGYQPIILPGESISKYQHLQARSAATQAHESAAHDSAQAAERDHADTGPEATPFAEPPVETFETETYPKEAPRSEDAGAAVLAGTDEEIHHGPGPELLGDTRDHEETTSFVAGEESPLARSFDDHHRFEQMNVAAIFGGDERARDASHDVAAHASPESRSEFAGVESGNSGYDQPGVAAAPMEVAEHGAPGGTSFAPGVGHVEEEEIDEEEAELAAPEAEPDDISFEELEEETIEAAPGGDGHYEGPERRRFPRDGSEQLTEAVEQTEPEQVAFAAEAARLAEHDDEAVESEEEGEEEFDEADEAQELAEQEYGATGRAELRGPAATAGFQRAPSRQQQFDRRRMRGGRRGRRGIRREPQRTQMISELLKEGQEILVQIAKEPIGKKGARITSHIALPGRFLVYMPTVNHIGVSRKISSEEERQRLKRIVISERENGHGGFIVRTAADHAPEEELRADIRFLKHLWHEIKQRSDSGKAPALIYHDLSLVERILRDQVNENFTAIWVDTEQDYERLIRFVNRFQPALVKRVKLYTKQTPLFEQFNIQEEINKALKSKVWLKSGGYIVINQTEALVAIDVNTGKYVGKTQRLEDTIVKTNVDAIREIVRQIRLRDLGGIIVIDFIDMDERKNRQRVMQALEDALKSDRAPSKVLQFNDFGLVAITRKRVKQSLERTLGTPCPYCTGTGFAKSVTTVCNEIWVEMRKMSRQFDHPDVMLRVHPEVGKALKANGGRWISEMEELTKRNIIVKSDALLHQEQFDIN